MGIRGTIRDVAIRMDFTGDISVMTILDADTNERIKTVVLNDADGYCMELEKLQKTYNIVREE